MQSVVINGTPRAALGKKMTKADRKAGNIPGVMYSPTNEVVHFTATINDLRPVIYTQDFKLATLTVEGKTYSCIVKDKQFHPVTDQLMHIDLLQVKPGHKIKVDIPVRFTGSAIGVKAGGKLQQLVRRIKIKALPEALIDEVTVDITDLNLGQVVRVREIPVNENIEIMNSPGIPLATIEVPRALRGKTATPTK